MKNVAIVLAMSAMSLACHTQGPTLAGKDRHYDPQMDSVVRLDEKQELLPWMNEPSLSIEQHGSRRGPTGSLEVVVVVRNRLEHAQAVELRAMFYDGTGFAEGNPSEFHVLNLPPNGTDRYSEMSLSPAAAHYVVEIRDAHRR